MRTNSRLVSESPLRLAPLGLCLVALVVLASCEGREEEEGGELAPQGTVVDEGSIQGTVPDSSLGTVEGSADTK
jgi:hypothetical protein